MREKSLCEFTCPCGRRYETSDVAAFACAACGRMLVIEWRGRHPAPPQLVPTEPEEPRYEPATQPVSNPA
jgi:hypothetical protein